MRPASVCVLAHNEAGKIEHALASVRDATWCDEILVFDSGSTDGTPEIARRYTDRVEHRDWVDFSTNRRAIVDAARNDWVFLLDADEEVSPELVDEVAALSDDALAAHPIFTMPRKNYLFGRHVKAWDPDRIDRLFDRTRVSWPSRSVHDTRTPTSGTTCRLSQPILHRPRVDDWGDYFDGPRYDTRTDALARELFDAGRRARRSDLWLRPGLTFAKYFLLKGGWTQGTFGLLVARKAASSVALKYARLWHLGRDTSPARSHARER